MSKKIIVEKEYHLCLRCEKAHETKSEGIDKCDTCQKYFCQKCYKIHDKHNECFCEHKDECYICGGKGFYDYGLKKPICWGHI